MEQMMNIECKPASDAGLVRSAEALRSYCPPSFEPAQGFLHDVYAASPADSVTANAFGLGLAAAAAAGKPVVWGLDAMTVQEVGQAYGPGLSEMGFPPHSLLLVRVRDVSDLLAVGEDILRSPGIGAVVLSAWGETRAFSLTASRRLSMAARSGGATAFLVRAGVAPSPSAAWTRWSVGACASRAMQADAPGRPVFSARLERHREGAPLRTWTLEWDRDRRAFAEIDDLAATLSGDLVSLAAQRPTGARETSPRNSDALRRTA